MYCTARGVTWTASAMSASAIRSRHCCPRIRWRGEGKKPAVVGAVVRQPLGRRRTRECRQHHRRQHPTGMAQHERRRHGVVGQHAVLHVVDGVFPQPARGRVDRTEISEPDRQQRLADGQPGGNTGDHRQGPVGARDDAKILRTTLMGQVGLRQQGDLAGRGLALQLVTAAFHSAVDRPQGDHPVQRIR